MGNVKENSRGGNRGRGKKARIIIGRARAYSFPTSLIKLRNLPPHFLFTKSSLLRERLFFYFFESSLYLSHYLLPQYNHSIDPDKQQSIKKFKPDLHFL